MPLTFVPPAGRVLICDYTTGFVPPEMTKLRPGVVMSPKSHRWVTTILVLPFSTTAPHIIQPHHVRIPANTYSFFARNVDVWAIANMVSAVSLARLSRL